MLNGELLALRYQGYLLGLTLYKKFGRYSKEGAKLSTRTRNKLQKFANNVLVLSSHALEHLGINGRVVR